MASPGAGKSRDGALPADADQEFLAGSNDCKRTPRKLHAVVVGNGRMYSIAQDGPVEETEEAIIAVIPTYWGGIAPGKPVGRRNRVARVEADCDVSLGLTLPARDDANPRQRVPVARNIQGRLGASQRGEQEGKPKAKDKQDVHRTPPERVLRAGPFYTAGLRISKTMALGPGRVILTPRPGSIPCAANGGKRRAPSTSAS